MMQYTLEEMITVQDYVNEMVLNARVETTMERVEDYVNAIRTESMLKNLHSSLFKITFKN